MPFSIRQFHRFLVQCDVTYHLDSFVDVTMTDIGNDRV